MEREGAPVKSSGCGSVVSHGRFPGRVPRRAGGASPETRKPVSPLQTTNRGSYERDTRESKIIC